jgi:hypothetical protein
MSEDTKIEKTEQDPKAAELSEQDLDKVAGGLCTNESIVREVDEASPL